MRQSRRAPPERTMKTYAVYILANASRMLYIGVTGDLDRRIWEHKKQSIPGYTEPLWPHSLVYFESFASIKAAIAREKDLKGWGPHKKVALINATNPNWTDLAATHFKKLQPPNPIPATANSTPPSSPRQTPPTPYANPNAPSPRVARHPTPPPLVQHHPPVILSGAKDLNVITTDKVSTKCRPTGSLFFARFFQQITRNVDIQAQEIFVVRILEPEFLQHLLRITFSG